MKRKEKHVSNKHLLYLFFQLFFSHHMYHFDNCFSHFLVLPIDIHLFNNSTVTHLVRMTQSIFLLTVFDMILYNSKLIDASFLCLFLIIWRKHIILMSVFPIDICLLKCIFYRYHPRSCIESCLSCVYSPVLFCFHNRWMNTQERCIRNE